MSEDEFPNLNRYQLANLSNDERAEYLKRRFRAFDLSAKGLRRDCKAVEGTIRKLKVMTLRKNPIKVRNRQFPILPFTRDNKPETAAGDAVASNISTQQESTRQDAASVF